MAISFCRSHTRDSMAPRLKQIAVLHVGLVNQCLELAVIQAAGEDGVDNLHHNRHDVNEVGRLGAKSLLVNGCSASCVWVGYVRRPHSGAPAATRRPSSGQSSLGHRRSSRRQGGRNRGSISPHTEASRQICLSQL